MGNIDPFFLFLLFFSLFTCLFTALSLCSTSLFNYKHKPFAGMYCLLDVAVAIATVAVVVAVLLLVFLLLLTSLLLASQDFFEFFNCSPNLIDLVTLVDILKDYPTMAAPAVEAACKVYVPLYSPITFPIACIVLACFFSYLLAFSSLFLFLLVSFRLVCSTCRIVNVYVLGSVVEGCMECHFLSSSSWSALATALHVPEVRKTYIDIVYVRMFYCHSCMCGGDVVDGGVVHHAAIVHNVHTYIALYFFLVGRASVFTKL